MTTTASTSAKDRHFEAWAQIRALRDYLKLLSSRTNVDRNYVQMTLDIERYLDEVRP